MSTVDQRVVSMQFDNKQFESGVSTTLNSLNNLRKGLDLSGASKGLDSVGQAANRINLSGLSSGVEAVKLKFSALQVTAITALTNITNSAIEAGKNLVSSLTIDPIIEGFKEYETQMNAVQTILANTSSKGTTLEEVKSALSELNTYSDKTIYNFTEMTRNIGTFTAAGVDLQTSTKAIKGIANLAAVSGSNSQQASSAMYQLSQALASGKVTLQDWNSVVNAGMGGAVFQNALRQTAKVMGKNVDEAQSFRESIDGQSGTGWLTSDVLLKTLAKFTGDMSEAELASQGYTEAQIADIMKMGQTANDAATKVKTFTQLIDTLKEAVGSGWAQTWQILFGDFEEAKVMFTDVSNTLGGLISQSSNARNALLQGWKDLGGRTVLIDAIKSAFDGVMQVVTAVSGAFRDIFPATTSQQLFSMTEGLKNIMDGLRLSDTNLANLRSTFKGFFAILDIGKQAIFGLIDGFSTILTGSDKLGSSLLAMTGSFGEWLTALDNSIKSSDVINKTIQPLAQNIRNVFNGAGNSLEYFGKKFTEVRDAVVKELNFDPWTSFSNLLTNISKVVENICNKISELQGKLSNLLTGFGEKFNGIDISTGIKKAYEGLTSVIVGGTDDVKKANDDATSSFSTSLNNFVKNIGSISLAGIGFAIAKMFLTFTEVFKKKANFDGLFAQLKDAIAGGLEKVTGTLDGVRGCLKAYQDQLKAGLLIKIATAVAILAASIVAVSLIDSNKLASSLAAIGGLFAELLVATKLFSLIGEFKASAVKSSIVMLTMSTSILILASAMQKIGKLDVKQTITSLVSILGLMTMMTLAVKVLSKDSGTFVKGALSIIAFAEAISILADACIKLSNLNPEQIQKGLLGIGVIMTELSIFLKTNPSMSLKTATAVLILAGALNVMYYAVKNIGSLDWETIKKGLLGIGGVLAEIALFDKFTSNAKNVLSTSASLILVAFALKELSVPLNEIGSLDWETIKKGLIGMGGALAEITLFNNLNSNAKNTITTAASLVIVAFALKELSIPLEDIGSLDWETIKKGLIGMGGALAEIAAFNRFNSGASGSITSTISLGIAVSALAILAKDLQVFGTMSWAEIAKGLVGMGGALTEIVIMMNSLSKNTPINALALIEICTALNIMSKAFQSFSTLSWEGIAKGLVATGLALGEISLAMKLIPADSIWTALGLTGVASALVMISKAMTSMGNLSWDGVAKGLVAIGGSLVLLAGGIKLMEGSLSGTAALIAAAFALNLLVAPILQLSTITWDGLIKSLVALAGTIAVLGIAAGLLTPVIPAMYGLSGALFILGIAIVGIGAGIGLATLGLQQLSQAFLNLDGTTQQGASNVTMAMEAMVVGIANGIPTLIAKIGEGIALMLQYLTNAIPAFCDFVLKTIVAITGTIATNIPLIMENVMKTLNGVLDSLIKWSPTLLQKVADLIMAILKSIGDNISKFVQAGVDIVVGFIKGVSDSLPKIIESAFNLIITFINGLADAIRNNSGAIGSACANLVSAIVEGIASLNSKFIEAGSYAVAGFVKGIGSSIGKVIDAGTSLGRKALDAAKKALDEHSPSKEFHQIGAYGGEGLANGLISWAGKVADASYSVGKGAVNSLSNAISGITDIVDSNIDTQPVIRPVLDLTDIQNGSNKLYNMMNGVGSYGINGSINTANSVAGSVRNAQIVVDNISNPNPSPINPTNNTPKQPVALQLVLQNGRAIAEYIIDDVDSLMGTKNKIAGRMIGV